MSNKDLIDVIDEMLEKLEKEDVDVINKTPNEFDNELKEKLDEVAKQKGYETYNSMLVAQVSPETNDNVKKIQDEYGFELTFILNYLRDGINGVEYDPKQMGLYKDGHQEALGKYFKLLKDTKDLNEVLRLCYIEESSINKIDTIRDIKLKGYKDGLYLFSIMVEDASEDLINESSK